MAEDGSTQSRTLANFVSNDENQPMADVSNKSAGSQKQNLDSTDFFDYVLSALAIS